MARIFWLKSAANDLKGIYEFIYPNSKTYAKHQILQIRRTTNILRKYPYAGKILKEYNIEALRETISGNYRVIYKIINPNTIHILLVHHGAKDDPIIK